MSTVDQVVTQLRRAAEDVERVADGSDLDKPHKPLRNPWLDQRASHPVEHSAGQRRSAGTSPNTRYEWQAVAVRDTATVTDARGICRHYTDAVRHVEKELAATPGDADAYGWVRGLTVQFAYANRANGAYERWDRQAVAVRGADGAITWFRDREVDGE